MSPDLSVDSADPVSGPPGPTSETPADSPTRRPSPPARVVIGAIHLYQRAFSWRASPCRYVPSCSSYAVEAVEVHGAGRGLVLAVRRLARCQPWGGQGWDPVPPAGHHHAGRQMS